jgi:hypothetical protein
MNRRNPVAFAVVPVTYQMVCLVYIFFWPRLVPAGFRTLHSVVCTVVFRLYLVKIIQTLTN